ncbi:MAG: hypothetical protein RLZZ450_588 [Pseudomonadota bacterium]|jgi:uncharacterized membrane protein
MRVLFVDVLRLLALFQMVNGHTLDAVLANGERTGDAFARYGYARGLVSVAFLVVAGISFHLTTVARLAEHRADPKAVRRRFTRAAQVVAVGYLLQVRWSADYFDPLQAEAAFRSLFRCEVLQCIGLSLLALELLALVCTRAIQLASASGALALAVFFLAPAAERASGHGAVSLVNGLLGHAQGSQFPLLPWSGYVFAGVVLGAVALPSRGATPTWRRVAGLLASAGAIGVASVGAHVVLPLVSHVRTSSTPWFVLEKLAVIALVLAVLALLTHSMRALPRPLIILGSETLVLFVFHLQVIYGGHWALAHRFGRALAWPEALSVALFNIVLTTLFGLAYHALKQRLSKRPKWTTGLLQTLQRPLPQSSLSANQAD